MTETAEENETEEETTAEEEEEVAEGEEEGEEVEEGELEEEEKEAVEVVEEVKEEGEEGEKEKAEEEEKAEERKIIEERIYTIPLGRAWVSPRNRRTPRAVRIVRDFIQRHMKPKNLLLSNEVNERIWSRGIQKPPRRIRVRAAKDEEGTVTLYLAEGD
ncbi:MAG: 50S ribosomal protein L31e [Candidatus Bathyarchaeia archaeon]